MVEFGISLSLFYSNSCTLRSDSFVLTLECKSVVVDIFCFVFVSLASMRRSFQSLILRLVIAVLNSNQFGLWISCNDYCYSVGTIVEFFLAC